MEKNFLESLKEKSDLLKKFDEQIAIRKAKKRVETTEADPIKILKFYQEEIKLRDEVKALEMLKNQYTKPDILDGLRTEFYKNVSSISEENKKLLDEATSLKEEYIANLKKIDERFWTLSDQYFALRNEYVNTAVSLGFTSSDAGAKFGSYWESSPAYSVAREDHAL